MIPGNGNGSIKTEIEMRKNGAKLKCNTVKYVPIFSVEMMDEKS